MSNNELIFTFTEKLSELLCSGISLKDSLETLCSLDNQSEQKLVKLSKSIFKDVFAGERLSLSLSNTNIVKFPSWYVGFVSAAEEGGDLGKTFAHLEKMLREKKSSSQKFISSLFYPLLIVVLSAVCGIVSVFALSSTVESFGGNSFVVREEALKSCLWGGSFLLCVSLSFIYLLHHISEPDLCSSFFNSLSFLTESGVPIVNAIDSSFPVIQKSNSFCSVVSGIRWRILAGGKVSEAFSYSLLDEGFKFESKIASINLSISEYGGKSDSFKKIAMALEKRHEKIRSFVLAIEQPILLCVAAIYLLIVLKGTLMKSMFFIG